MLSSERVEGLAMAIRLEVENYRCLRKIAWEPEGVCALVGPNGSGKTTLLNVFDMLRRAYETGFAPAIQSQGGLWGVRHLRSGPTDRVQFMVRVDRLSWRIQLREQMETSQDPAVESIYLDGDLLLEKDSAPPKLRGAFAGQIRLPGHNPLL